MEYIYSEAEVDEMPYGSFSVRVPYVYKRIEYRMWREPIIRDEKIWLHIDENGRVVNGWNPNPIKTFATVEEAEKFLQWFKSREEKEKLPN